ncbi:hypothetical protein [Gymnodinialimonas sp.]
MSDTLDAEAVKQFNLLTASPTFAISVGADGVHRLKTPAVIETGLWLVGGTSHLPSGDTIASVFEVNADSTDAIARVYWQTPLGWCDTSARPQLLAWMGREDDTLFPCRFETSIPLAPGLSSA